MNLAFWRGRRVLLTGHTGFKGAWLALLLERLGAKVVGFALAPSDDRGVFARAHLAGRVRSIIGDVRDETSLRAAVTEAAPEVIFHLAAQALVLSSYETPLETFSTNVMGTAMVLEAARHASSLRAVVVVTSDKVYENREWTWGYRENDRLGGRDPYSSSKACAELITAAYRDSFLRRDGIAVATSRAGNVIGGGDWAKNRIVPDFVRAVADGRSLTVRNPKSTRPWQHVLEPLVGYLLLAERLVDSAVSAEGAWNFGPPAEAVQPVWRLADELAARWGDSASWIHESAEQAHEATALTLDSTKAGVELGWRPRLAFTKAVHLTADWYRAFLRGEDMDVVTRSQIDSYLEMTI